MFEYITYKDKQGKDAIYEYIEELAQKAQTSKTDKIKLKKIFEYLDILMQKGTWAGEPYVKKIDGDIWELRPIDTRIFFAYWKDNMFILLHHLPIKKTQKTPPKDIKQAKANLKDWLERNDN
ncbi:MAG: type II toxin-antitoxin system RelE/ParE family toxin [Oscillospiraceae bacterium]|nr:type II toxin-antitoxin system RelE/ParE family toxin [Oscillospiraceae bacterium]